MVLGLSLSLQWLFSVINLTDDILGWFTMVIQIWIEMVDLFNKFNEETSLQTSLSSGCQISCVIHRDKLGVLYHGVSHMMLKIIES